MHIGLMMECDYREGQTQERTSDSLQKMDIRAAHAENRLMAACL